MKVDRYYFSHDFYSRSNLRDIQMKHGMQGIGVYWCIVEILHENNGIIKESDVPFIAYDLHTDEELCKSVIYDFNKFDIKAGKITSQRVKNNLKKTVDISNLRREAALKRWNTLQEPEGLLKTSEEELRGINTPTKQENATEAKIKPISEDVKTFAERLIDKATEVSANNAGDENLAEGLRTLSSIIDAVLDAGQVKIANKRVTASEYLERIQWFCRSELGMQRVAEIRKSIEAKGDKIKNKSNYLISAIYMGI